MACVSRGVRITLDALATRCQVNIHTATWVRKGRGTTREVAMARQGDPCAVVGRCPYISSQSPSTIIVILPRVSASVLLTKRHSLTYVTFAWPIAIMLPLTATIPAGCSLHITWAAARSGWAPTLLLAAAAVCLLLAYRRLVDAPATTPGGPGSIPEASSLPRLGNLSTLWGLPHHAVSRLARTYGHIFRVNIGGDRTFVVLNDHKTVIDAMRRFPTAMAGKPTSTTTELTGAHGAHQDQGKRWGRRRQITMSAYKSFFRQSAYTIHGVCEDELDGLLQALEGHGPDGYDSHDVITSFIARTMFRLTYGQGEQPDEDICRRLKAIVDNIDDYTKNAGPFSKLDRFPFLRRFQEASLAGYKKATGLFKSLCKDSSARRVAITEQDGESQRDLMAFFIRGAQGLTTTDKQRLGLTEELLYDGLEDLIRAGIESPSLLLQWVLLALASFPEVQSRLATELQAHARREQQTIICEDNLDLLPYCKAVFFETVRYFSVVPFLKRRTLDDVIIGGHAIPANTNLLINNHAISHDPAVWQNPELFNPQRFLLQDGTFDKTSLERFLPFGIGKRRCMGEELGRMLPFAAMATMTLHFEVSSPDGRPLDLSPSFGITLSPKPQKLVFTRRQEAPLPRSSLLLGS